MPEEIRGMGCCSSWIECSIFGYCTHYLGQEYGFKQCDLAKNLLVDQLPGWKEMWFESATRALTKFVSRGESEQSRSGYLLRCCTDSAILREELDGSKVSECADIRRRILEERNRPRPVYTPGNSGSNSSSNQVPYRAGEWVGKHSFTGLHIVITKEGTLYMNNITVVAEKGDFELISWSFRDLVHYGIRLKDSNEMIEKFAPSSRLKGWPLRKFVTEELGRYNDKLKELPPNIGKHKIATTNAEFVYPGDILVYWNPTKEEFVYSKVLGESEHCFFYRTHKGTDSMWTKESLKSKMENGIVNVIDPATLPEGITFPEEGHL